MRVAVYLPPDHPEHGGGADGHVAVAFRLGRIEEGVHNAPLGHAAQPIADFVAALVSEAKAEYPGAEVRVERLVHDGDGAKWVADDEFDPEVHQPLAAGNQREAEMQASAGQNGG